MNFYDFNKKDDNFDNGFNNDENKLLEVNKKNSDEYDKLMQESATDLDKYYYDKNNPIVKIILLVLGIFIVVGTVAILVYGIVI